MEVNPFHNGHKYFLSQIEKNEGDVLIAVISTTITQRGEFSVLSKKFKTKMLLNYGVDIVVELPSIFANQGGMYFSEKAIEILNSFNINKLYCGSESNNIDFLIKNIDLDFTDFKKGIYSSLDNFSSNDILALSYLKAIKKFEMTTEVILVKRLNNAYNDTSLKFKISSGTSIRENINCSEVLNSMDIEVFNNYLHYSTKELDVLFINNLYVCYNKNINIFLSESGQLINKFIKYLKYNKFVGISELCYSCCDKNNSRHKLKRLCINIIFLQEENFDNKINYIHVLGFNSKASKLIKGDIYVTSLKNLQCSVSKYETQVSRLLNYMCENTIVDDLSSPLIRR